ncbi:MAG: DUF4149 domain-containing protein [Pseudomonadota bacterium]
METMALLATALLFGGMVLYSFGFAAFIFTALPVEVAGPTIRRAFPHFYLFVIAASVVAALPLAMVDPVAAIILATVALTTVPTRQILMPAINAATDAGQKRRFGILHTVSVVITLAHIVAVAVVLARFI